MSFTDQQPFEVTQRELELPWGCRKDGSIFRCGLCGHKFQIGNVVRWVYSAKIGNFFTCSKCDGEDILYRWENHYSEYQKSIKGKWWYFNRR